jgi:squalene cyclase
MERALRAQRLALDRLLEQRNGDGFWFSPVFGYAVGNAIHVMMLRTTGLILQEDGPGTEAGLIRHMVSLTNPDGGFYCYPGGGSSRSLTRIALLALRLAMGKVQADERPAEWFAPNPLISGELGRLAQSTAARAGAFLRDGRAGAGPCFELIHAHVLYALSCAVEPGRVRAPMIFYQPEAAALILRASALGGLRRQFGQMLRRGLPAGVLLYGQSQERQPGWGRVLRFARRLPGLGGLTARSIDDLVAHVRATQGSSGGWAVTTIQTMVNVMALHLNGVPVDDPSIRRARAFIGGRVRPADDGLSVDLMGTDVWTTAGALYSYLAIPGNRPSDGAVREAVERLLEWQGPDGSFAWCSGFEGDADADTTGLALRAVSMAMARATGDLRRRLDRARLAALRCLRARQDADGGFSAWQSTFTRYRPGAMSSVGQFFFDTASADVTGRVLEGLAHGGLTWANRPVERALGFLARTQCADGSWWCRWWAGYLAGTSCALRGLGAAGMRFGSTPPAGGRRVAQAHAALARGVKFLLQHQNADGGWGETVEADSRPCLAGCGPSTPLHTATVVSALLRAGSLNSSGAVRQGVGHLLDTMSADGGWHDEQSTFTIVSRGWYYPFPFHTYLSPLEALTDFLASADGGTVR